MSGTEDLHASVEAIVDDEVVGHAHTMGFHGMALAIVVVPDFGVVEVRNSAGAVFGCHLLS